MEAVQNVLQKLHMGGSAEKAAPPMEPTQDEVTSLREKYEKAKQEQVFAFYDELSSTEKATLYQQLADIDPERINEITHRALNPPKPENDDKQSGLEPLPDSATASILDSKAENIEKWYQSGLDLIAANKVAVVLMAGGQGTRLGSSAPKGCFDIGLPSKKSLFQIQAERIRRIEHLAHKKAGHGDGKKVVVPWYVMTSGPTRGPTEQYFKEHKYFGLEKENVIIFEQGVLPCISNEGKILLDSKSKVGIYRVNEGYWLIVTIGCSRSRWEWWHLPSSRHFKCHG
jgi:UDP-N-acetylglucosamine/UDP-N-acetylgalactosamine diphosphorylase